MRALVVDDSSAMRAILRKILVELGCEVMVAADGPAALRLLAGESPCDLALLDWNMPGMSGMELLLAIRANSVHDTMKVMMVTTESQMEQMCEALDAGANEYVMKPFTKDVITDKLHILGW